MTKRIWRSCHHNFPYRPLRPSKYMTTHWQSEHSIYSNPAPAKTKIGKHDYTSSELAYNHIRAVTHKKLFAASHILLSRNPYDIMKIGAEFKFSEEWLNQEDNIMFACILKKFEQNPDLHRQLIATGDMELVEVQWTGTNKQGQVLMTVRDSLNLKEEEAGER